ncbi:MAG: hypothetical protein Sylvanvirus7_19 [Sylvanvirus sp.]|uniref:Uncharacterized protein n=1 Tax=Sylvanvirus sp. TaxID=2487774 RepID=A0A3G5AJN3_9VIRU|nr:MAG: hypothetical protein Sylvanvirus7_19 [Sylvanvirus sp.]
MRDNSATDSYSGPSLPQISNEFSRTSGPRTSLEEKSRGSPLSLA